MPDKTPLELAALKIEQISIEAEILESGASNLLMLTAFIMLLVTVGLRLAIL